MDRTSHYNGSSGWLNMKMCQNAVVTKFFHTFVSGWTSVGGVKGYLCYKSRTSQNIPSETQAKNSFVS